MIDAIVLAGRANEGKLRDYSQVSQEAMIPIAGRPMLAYIAEALAEARDIGRIVIVGPAGELGPAVEGFQVTFTEPAGGIMENVLAGAARLGEADQILVTTSDIPLITSGTVDGFITECRRNPADLYYPIIERKAIEARFPTTTRTYARLKDGTFTGANMVLVRLGALQQVAEVAGRFVDARKSPLKMASLLGFGFILKLLLGSARLAELEEVAQRILGVTGRVVITQEVEMGIDVDKPSDLELVEQVLARA